MLNTNKTPNLVSVYTALRDGAAEAMEAAAAAVRTYKGGDPAEEARLDAALDVAWEAFEEAQDNLREARDGYRQTFPHPMGSIHPHDGYMPRGR